MSFANGSQKLCKTFLQGKKFVLRMVRIIVFNVFKSFANGSQNENFNKS
jgi:tRNA U38,U39,U40 pseudouridine synthase TruA